MRTIWRLLNNYAKKSAMLKKNTTDTIKPFRALGLCLFPVVCALDLSGTKRIEIPNQKDLSHEHLIQQAASVSVNAASQLLTQTVVAIVDISNNYKKALLELLSLLEESQNNIVEASNINDDIVALRVKANEFKQQLLDLDSLLEYVEKVVISTAETSFLIGAEFVSSLLTERLYSIKLQLEEKRKEVAEIENECLLLQQKIIFESK